MMTRDDALKNVKEAIAKVEHDLFLSCCKISNYPQSTILASGFKSREEMMFHFFKLRREVINNLWKDFDRDFPDEE